jgi:phosphomannomutase/phosphoglucomutase
MLKCFKAYDIRGRVPDELNEDIAYRIGRAYVEILKPRDVVVGQDVRLDSPTLAAALTRGINDAGASVIDIGLVWDRRGLFPDRASSCRRRHHGDRQP